MRIEYSQNELTLTFGLGQAMRVARVEIVWPSGTVDVYQDVPGDTTLHAVEGQQPEQVPGAVPPLAAVSAPATELPDATTSRTHLAHTQAGMAAYDAERYADAAQAFEAARSLRPSEPLPYRYLADLYWRQGQPEQAAHVVQALAEVMPDAYFLDRLGSSYEESELPGLALLLYREAVRVDPHFPGARYNLGRLFLKQGEMERGIAEVQEALRLYPGFAEAHEVLAMAYTEQGQLEAALASLQQALTLHPDLVTARNHLGRLYGAQGRLDEAAQTFRDLVARHPDLAETRHNLAVAYARKGLQEQAVEQFHAAVRLRPDFHEARLDLATLLLEMRRAHDAIAVLQPLLAAVSEPAAAGQRLPPSEVRYRLSLAYLMAGQHEEGVSALQMVLAEHPGHAGAHAQLAGVYYQTRQFTRAWQHARQAEALGAPVAALIAGPAPCIGGTPVREEGETRRGGEGQKDVLPVPRPLSPSPPRPLAPSDFAREEVRPGRAVSPRRAVYQHRRHDSVSFFHDLRALC